LVFFGEGGFSSLLRHHFTAPSLARRAQDVGTRTQSCTSLQPVANLPATKFHVKSRHLQRYSAAQGVHFRSCLLHRLCSKPCRLKVPLDPPVARYVCDLALSHARGSALPVWYQVMITWRVNRHQPLECAQEGLRKRNERNARWSFSCFSQRARVGGRAEGTAVVVTQKNRH
jgi:hypothetical protein